MTGASEGARERATPFKPLGEVSSSPEEAERIAQARAVIVTLDEKLHVDSKRLVQSFAEELARKLRAAEVKYRYGDGWLTDDWQEECLVHLHEHLAKGDPRDVAIYAAFMWARGWSTAAQPALGLGVTRDRAQIIQAMQDHLRLRWVLTPDGDEDLEKVHVTEDSLERCADAILALFEGSK